MGRTKKSYEEKFQELKEFVKSFEGDELPLEIAMNNYEKGIKLCNELYKELKEVEGKIQILNKEEEV
ncbi:exodeoxyribonuclease VII small subunit [Oceanirhabdus sp. W0125-5]|uniref:exodeoxyribonuclease VII small subunit n=1 Tax=Oceanirhabdus sp. W0125-5 TaxID=2999116 RepID=UPI0022F2F830|nr:exodeoxyribonuclease VII small subunit [Oceanirhabdus sp. W0125-5]WBW95323.1 exodeoxyribonuclease VII small subunit [Oceanirhabdus sp. W0125-5]